jgi:hypothetical protein
VLSTRPKTTTTIRMKPSLHRWASAAAALAVIAARAASALSVTPTRRAFLNRLPIAVAAAGVSAVVLQPPQLHGVSCDCGHCQCGRFLAVGVGVPPAAAYERRDVGGENASAETQAMNLQAYETNNRLERQGLKLEVRACVCAQNLSGLPCHWNRTEFCAPGYHFRLVANTVISVFMHKSTFMSNAQLLART